MRMAGIPFGTTDWSKVEQTEHKGERGFAYYGYARSTRLYRNSGRARRP